MHRLSICLLVWVGLTGLIACQPSDLGPRPRTKTHLTVSAAASVQTVLGELEAVYQQTDMPQSVVYNFGGSGSLAQQIAQGASVDIFLSAAPRWMEFLEKEGHVLVDSRRDLLQNELVLVVPKGSDIRAWDHLATVDRLAIGEPSSVPAGQYGTDVLTALGLLARLRSHLVLGKSVRQVLTYVETGNVDAGIVYATDALRSEKITVVAPAPPNSHGPIVYPIAVVKTSRHGAAAQKFVDFLSSAPAAEVFHQYGFTVP